MSNYHIVGNHMSRLICVFVFSFHFTGYIRLTSSFPDNNLTAQIYTECQNKVSATTRERERERERERRRERERERVCVGVEWQNKSEGQNSRIMIAQ